MASFTQIGALVDFTAGTTIVSADVDQNFSDIRTVVNQLITGVNTINADTINEVTSASGVTIDSVVLKDGAITSALTATLAVDTTDTYLMHFNRSDVDTGLTPVSPADETTVFHITSSSTGGATLSAQAEAADTTVLNLHAFGGTAPTGKTSGDNGLITFFATELSGASSDNITANGNVLSVSAQVGGSQRTLFIIDEDGDFLYDGSDGGAFDSEDDVALVRAFALATSKDVIRTDFDDFVRYNEDDLVRLGILGDRVENGGLVNGAQLQRLLVGAVWQQAQALEEMRAEIKALTP